MSEQSIIVGIDLGTTNSVAALFKDDGPQTIPIDNAKLLPSIVSLTAEGYVVGKVAKNMALLEPDKTVVSIKRRMGEDISLSIGGHQMRPEEISALILKKIKQSVENHLSLSADSNLRAVITVPAYFTEEQRGATQQAAVLAGLTVERIINEPTAAGLAFGLSQMDEAVYAIYDFGGGTFDVSIIESNAGLIEVMATRGDNHLGGDDLDRLLADHIWDQFVQTNNIKAGERSKKEEARLLRIAEHTKVKLSDQLVVEIQESFFYQLNGTSYHLEQSITRDTLEELIAGKIKETVQHLEEALKDAKLELEELDGIVLVGGSSRIPLITSQIEERLGIAPVLIDLPDEAVAHGAAIQGAIIDKIDIDTVLVDITPHSLGIGTMDDVSFRMANLNFIKKREEEELDLAAAVIIPKNTPVPARKSKKFQAVSPFQKGYEIQVFQGEQKRFADNKLIGETHLEVQNPIEYGEIEVTFKLDINGLLHITATETTTKEKVKTKFKSSRGMKIKKNKLDELVAMSMDEAENTLLRRAEKLLETQILNEEDQSELEELTQQYKAQQLAGESTESTEAELLDLLYYLEKHED